MNYYGFETEQHFIDELRRRIEKDENERRQNPMGYVLKVVDRLPPRGAEDQEQGGTPTPEGG
jgi:hypothetical protein